LKLKTRTSMRTDEARLDEIGVTADARATAQPSMANVTGTTSTPDGQRRARVRADPKKRLM
jgi:hypothetical protein